MKPPSTTNSSRLDAVTSPARWGYRVVHLWSDGPHPARNQTTAVAGELLQHLETGEVRVFLGRVGRELLLGDLPEESGDRDTWDPPYPSEPWGEG